MWKNTINRNQHQDDTDARVLGELSDKNFKAGRKVLQQVKVNIAETNEKLENHKK